MKGQQNHEVMISAYVGDQHDTWVQWIPEFRFAINAAQHEKSERMTAELMTGRLLEDHWNN